MQPVKLSLKPYHCLPCSALWTSMLIILCDRKGAIILLENGVENRRAARMIIAPNRQSHMEHPHGRLHGANDASSTLACLPRTGILPRPEPSHESPFPAYASLHIPSCPIPITDWRTLDFPSHTNGRRVLIRAGGKLGEGGLCLFSIPRCDDSHHEVSCNAARACPCWENRDLRPA